MKKIMFICLFFVFGTVHAASVTVAFPSGTSTTTAAASQYFWNPAHSVSESFSGTGINSLTGLDLSLNLDGNVLSNGSSVIFDVLVNATSVGGFSFDAFDALGQYEFSFSFAEIIGNGTYNLTLQVLNTVPRGAGSINFSETASFATLNGDMSSVPIPAAAFMFAPAILGFMGFRRKAKNSVA